jgi:hypothetical protein
MMSSQHENPARTYRPDPDELRDARGNLPAGRSMNTFLRACLRTLRDDPDAIIALVHDRWPEEKPLGRKRTKTAEE